MSKQLTIGGVTLTKIEATETITKLTEKIKSEVLTNTIGHAVAPAYLASAGVATELPEITTALQGAEIKPEEVTGYTVYEGAFYAVSNVKAERRSGASTSRTGW